MTEHATTETARITGGQTLLARATHRIRVLLRNWKARRAVQRLAEFDDHLLADIGVTCLDVHWAAGLPLTVNAAMALEERARLRRARRLGD